MQRQQAAAGTAGRRPRAVAEECRTLYVEAADPEGFPRGWRFPTSTPVR
ncbi:hypothetical protein BX261_1991 [Streptomyces sp. 2321.6]|nr:hypothetical protein BX261_1991 [Streptomyces sp. 2321.6]